jgi:hypothetical protein
MSSSNSRSRFLIGVVLALGIFSTAYATMTYLNQFSTAYPAAGAIASCSLCHSSLSTYARNSYGADFAANGHSFAAIESLDSDGDGFTNIQEIEALTLPGDSSSHPSPPPPPPADTQAPTVTAFQLSASSSSLTVPITAFTATDNLGVTGYQATESATAPAAGAAGWTASPPSSYTFASEGTKTLYGWARDAAGNVSAARSATTTITLPPTTGGTPEPDSDKVAPTITSFAIPEASEALTVPITSFAASDNVGVTGYLVTESPGAPRRSKHTRWLPSPPASFTFSSAGRKTLYAWVKDAAGNISTGASSSTTITLQANDLGGMENWEGKWFEVSVPQTSVRESNKTGYLRLSSWDPRGETLQATLYTRDTQTGQWQPVSLVIHYASGDSLSFLAWFEYANAFQFAAEITGRWESGTMRSGSLRAVGIYHLNGNGENSEDRAEQQSEGVEDNEFLVIRGILADLNRIPPELLNN